MTHLLKFHYNLEFFLWFWKKMFSSGNYTCFHWLLHLFTHSIIYSSFIFLKDLLFAGHWTYNDEGSHFSGGDRHLTKSLQCCMVNRYVKGYGNSWRSTYNLRQKGNARCCIKKKGCYLKLNLEEYEWIINYFFHVLLLCVKAMQKQAHPFLK